MNKLRSKQLIESDGLHTVINGRLVSVITSKEALGYVEAIKMQVKMGNKSYEQGKLEATPYIEIINTKAKEIAKKYNKRPQLYSWRGLSH